MGSWRSWPQSRYYLSECDDSFGVEGGEGRWMGVVRRSVRLLQIQFAREQLDTELLKSIASSHFRTVANESSFGFRVGFDSGRCVVFVTC